MLVTAELRRGECTLDEVAPGQVFRIDPGQRDIMGDDLVIVAGPHPAYAKNRPSQLVYSRDAVEGVNPGPVVHPVVQPTFRSSVYTVDLRSLPEKTAAWERPLPYNETADDGAGEFVTVQVE
jgi:hypothetical protein